LMKNGIFLTETLHEGRIKNKNNRHIAGCSLQTNLTSNS